jgi:putative Holliday junction resolvase
MKYLGVDPGENRVGLAVSDPDGKLAMPLYVLHLDGSQAQVEAIAQVAVEQRAEAIVVGMPYTLRGQVGPAAARVQQQVETLRAHTTLPVHVYDERFSSGIAERVLLEADVSRAGRKLAVDKLAASIMLQSFLDRQSAEERRS